MFLMSYYATKCNNIALHARRWSIIDMIDYVPVCTLTPTPASAANTRVHIFGLLVLAYMSTCCTNSVAAMSFNCSHRHNSIRHISSLDACQSKVGLKPHIYALSKKLKRMNKTPIVDQQLCLSSEPERSPCCATTPPSQLAIIPIRMALQFTRLHQNPHCSRRRTHPMNHHLSRFPLLAHPVRSSFSCSWRARGSPH